MELSNLPNNSQLNHYFNSFSDSVSEIASNSNSNHLLNFPCHNSSAIHRYNLQISSYRKTVWEGINCLVDIQILRPYYLLADPDFQWFAVLRRKFFFLNISDVNEIKWRKYLFHSSANGICTPALRFLIDECRIIKFFSGYIVNLVKPDMKLVDMCCMQSKPGRKHFEHCHWQTRVKYKNCCSSNRCSSDRLQNVKRKGLTLLPFSVSTSFESGRLSFPPQLLRAFYPAT